MTHGQFDLEVLECRNYPRQRRWIMLHHSLIHSLFIILSSEMQQALLETSNSANILVTFHVFAHLHHSGNFHIRNKQLFIDYLEEVGRYNDLYFPSSVIYVFLTESIIIWGLYVVFFQIPQGRACDPALASHDAAFSMVTLIGSGKDTYVFWLGQSPSKTHFLELLVKRIFCSLVLNRQYVSLKLLSVVIFVTCRESA